MTTHTLGILWRSFSGIRTRAFLSLVLISSVITTLAHSQISDFTTASGDLAPKPVVTVLISSNDQPALLQTLRNFSQLRTSKRVVLGTAYLIGDPAAGLIPGAGIDYDNLVRQLQRPNPRVDPLSVVKRGASSAIQDIRETPAYKILEPAGIDQYEYGTAEDVLESFKLEYSPTWLVRHLGKIYIFEGYSTISNYFDRNGNFRIELLASTEAVK